MFFNVYVKSSFLAYQEFSRDSFLSYSRFSGWEVFFDFPARYACMPRWYSYW